MATTPITGHGGTVVKYANAALGSAVTFHNSKWELDLTPVLVEITDSSGGGWQKHKRVVKGGTFNIEFILDTLNLPDTNAGFVQGDEVVIRFNIGASTPQKFYRFPAIIESVKVTNEQSKDVVKGTISGKVNGAVTYPVTGAVTNTY